MKASDAEILAAAARAGLGANAVRAAGDVIAAAAEGWLDVLAAGQAANVRGSDIGQRTEPSRHKPNGDQQLLAAAHAVAAHWLSASQLTQAAQARTAYSGDSPPVARASNPQAFEIRVNHVTPDGGLAAVDLNHPDLGELGIEISLSGNTLSVLATAESEHAAAAIREGQAALAAQLLAQGIKLQALSVVVLRRRAKALKSKSGRQES